MLLGEKDKMRRAYRADWQSAKNGYAKRSLCKGVFAALPFLFVFGASLHFAQTYNEVFGDSNYIKLESTAQHWTRTICADNEQVLKLDVHQECNEYNDWASRSYRMNVLRISLLAHLGHIGEAWTYLTTFDPIVIFDARQLVHSICSQAVVFMPVLFCIIFMYAILLLRYPIKAFRESVCLLSQDKRGNIGKIDENGTLSESERDNLSRKVLEFGNLRKRFHQTYENHAQLNRKGLNDV